MANNHVRSVGRDLGKRGMQVDVKYSSNDSSDARIKSMDNAIKTLKRRMLQEGVIRDMRRKEYFESKGTKRRKAFKEAVLREKASQAKREF